MKKERKIERDPDTTKEEESERGKEGTGENERGGRGLGLISSLLWQSFPIILMHLRLN